MNSTTYPNSVPVNDVGAIVGESPVVNPFRLCAMIVNATAKKINPIVSPIISLGMFETDAERMFPK